MTVFSDICMRSVQVDACFAQFSRRIGDLVLQSEANRARVCALGGAELLSRLLGKAVDDAVRTPLTHHLYPFYALILSRTPRLRKWRFTIRQQPCIAP